MARDLGPKCRICRREGIKLFLKGERCLTEKCGIERRSYPPGQHGRGRTKQSEYLTQLREKQKAKRYYGVLDAALLGQAALALEEQLHALTATLLALGTCATGHRFLSAGVLRRAAACAAGNRCAPAERRP